MLRLPPPPAPWLKEQLAAAPPAPPPPPSSAAVGLDLANDPAAKNMAGSLILW